MSGIIETLAAPREESPGDSVRRMSSRVRRRARLPARGAAVHRRVARLPPHAGHLPPVRRGPPERGPGPARTAPHHQAPLPGHVRGGAHRGRRAGGLPRRDRAVPASGDDLSACTGTTRPSRRAISRPRSGSTTRSWPSSATPSSGSPPFDIDEYLVPQPPFGSITAALDEVPARFGVLQMEQVVATPRWGEDRRPRRDRLIVPGLRRCSAVVPYDHGVKTFARSAAAASLGLHGHQLVAGFEILADRRLLQYHFRGFPEQTEQTEYRTPIAPPGVRPRRPADPGSCSSRPAARRPTGHAPPGDPG